MARKTLTSEERRDRTVAATMRVFARKGFSGASTRALSKAAGVSEALLFKLFGTKQGLYREIVRRKIERTGRQAVFPREAVEAGDDEKVFSTVGGVILESMESDPTFLRLLLYSALEGEKLSEMFVDQRISKVIDFLGAYIRKRIRERAFAKVDGDLAAIQFIGTMVTFAMAKQIMNIRRFGMHRQRKVVDTAVGIFLSGLRRKGR